MGRDFYDAVFLFGKRKPNFGYLQLKLKIKNVADLRSELLDKCSSFNFEQLAKDVEGFANKALCQFPSFTLVRTRSPIIPVFHCSNILPL